MSFYCACYLVRLGECNVLYLCDAALHGLWNLRASDRRLQDPMAKTELFSLTDR